jgi:ElaB/YqjD/DUF883 family membrane-anchored ribosome-binding protein
MSMYGIREGRSAGEWVMNTVSRNPEGLLLLAAGAALLMRSGRGQRTRYPQSKDSGGRQYPESQYSQSGKGMSERLSEAVQRAGEYVSEATDEVAGTARSYASSAMDYADEATQAAMERSRRLAEQAQETTDYVVQEQPWAVALGGLIAGTKWTCFDDHFTGARRAGPTGRPGREGRDQSCKISETRGR